MFSSKVSFFEEFVLRIRKASPLTNPFFTLGGWQEVKCVYWKVSLGLKCVFTSRIDWSLNLSTRFPYDRKFSVPTSPDHSQSLVPKLLNVFCCWSWDCFDIGFEVIWFVVVDGRNCWCWPTFVFWIRCVFSFGCCINRWNWTDVIVDLERKCWTVDWLLMLEVILIPWILHHFANHTLKTHHLFILRRIKKKLYNVTRWLVSRKEGNSSFHFRENLVKYFTLSRDLAQFIKFMNNRM